jgi:signal transduction histidine kinase
MEDYLCLLEKTQIEIIHSSSKAKEVYLNIVKAATKEIMIIFPTINAFIRQEQIGAIQISKEAANERNVKVRILMPVHKLAEKTILQLRQPGCIDVRYIEQTSGTQATILVVDKKVSLVMAIRDDSKMNFIGAIGLSTYSKSKAGVLSYVSIFENLWKQTELYKQLENASERLELANEQLRNQAKMQREFINVAAHELRTPIQPILSLSEVLRSKRVENSEQHDEILDTVIRNAKRLHQLTEDILDVTKIESKILKLNIARFNLNHVILNVLDDIVLTTQFKGKNIQILYQPQDIFLEADKDRVIQVISNLINNAFKFTKTDGGIISVNVEKEKREGNDYGEGDNNQEVVVRVKDTGSGIDPEIFPKLFDKFASKSFQGTGLGLFISKSIVEAHYGRMWAENNNNADARKGATFYFTLPIVCKEQHSDNNMIVY